MARVLITGTSTGIGLASALAFGRRGHEVYATMRNAPHNWGKWSRLRACQSRSQ
jgi:NAD(P)-dependent dehydrogenase (short-subunit alcohol dehydrogenase family)